VEKMIYLFDTDIFIFMIRGLKPARRPAQRQKALQLVQRCRQFQTGGDEVGLSALTVSELEFGARNSGRYEDEIAAVYKVLTPFEVYDYDSVQCPLHWAHPPRTGDQRSYHRLDGFGNRRSRLGIGRHAHFE